MKHNLRTKSFLLLCLLYTLCGATEYYVRPSGTTNTSCPGQPCLTLAQYINKSDHYFKSNNNTVFWLLSGTHSIARPVIITDAHNVTFKKYGLEDNHPRVIFSPTYNCQCDLTLGLCPQCSAVQFYNVTMAIVKGIAVIGTRYTNSSIHGLTFDRCDGSVVQGVSVAMKQVSMCTSPQFCVGVLLYETGRASLLNLVLNYSNIYSDKSQNVVISNVTIYKPPRDGISCKRSTDIEIQKARISFSGVHCIRLRNVSNTLVHYANLTECGDNGVYLINSTNTNLNTLNFQNISSKALSLDAGSSDTYVANTFIGYCPFNGIAMYGVFNTTIENTTVVDSGVSCLMVANTSFINVDVDASSGISLFRAVHTVISNSTFTIRYDTNDAILFSESSDILIKNITADASIAIFSGHQITFNHIQIKSAIKPAVVVYKSTGVTVQNTHFEGISQLITDITDLPAVLVFYQSTNIEIGHCTFSHNTISALKAVASNFTVTGTLNFSNNTASLGAAMILQQRSVMILSNDSFVQFIGNHATNVGGAIYVDTNTFYTYSSSADGTVILSSECFYQTHGEVSGKKLFFYDNSASNGGDVVYGGHMGLATSADNSNCLLDFNNISQIYVNNTLSVISSQPSRVCVCNSSTGQPDCLSVFHTHSVYPGETTYLPAVVVGQDFGTGAGSVYALFLSSDSTRDSQLKQWQYSQGVSQHHCNQLTYSILAAPTCNIVLVLSAVEMNKVQHIVSNGTVQSAVEKYNTFLEGDGLFPQDLLDFSVYVNISVRPCPVGFTLSTPPYKCECSSHLSQLPGIECYIETQTFERRGSTWLGFDSKNRTMTSNYCPYRFCNQNTVNITVDTTDDQCNYDHSGILCGGCQHGLSLPLGSSKCLSCSNNYYLFLIVPFALAGLVLVFTIKLLDITVSNGYVNSLVFYVNIIHSVWPAFIPQGHDNPLAILVAWANLDLGIETCFFDGLSSYWKTWLEFVFPLYLWSISGMIIIAAKYSNRISHIMGSNSVSVLATLFLLSYAKLLHTSTLIMANYIIQYPHKQKKVWALDGNIDYLGPRHLPLFVVAVAVLVLLCIPYTLILLCGQWLYKCRNHFVSRMMFRIKPIMDAYYGPLKDKHRYWVGVLLISRAAIHVALALIPDPNPTFLLLVLSIMSICLLQVNGYVMGFYSNWYITVFEVTLLSNLALYSLVLVYTIKMEVEAQVITNIFIAASIIQMSVLVLYRMLRLAKKALPRHVRVLISSWMSTRLELSRVECEKTSLTSSMDSERLLINRDTPPTYGI